MKSTVIPLVVLAAFILCLNGCGGESSSSGTNIPPPSPIETTNSIEINPLLELGLEKGMDICISIKAYSNSSKSKLSEAVCTKINDSQPIELSWNHTSTSVIGYEIFYGNSKNNARNFLQNVMSL